MLDIVDAFVRESSASMEYVSRGKFFRKVLVRGLPKSFRAGATVINAGIDAMDRKVRDLAEVAQKFGSSMDLVARELDAAASELESDAGSMAAAAGETSRQSTAVAAASEQASVNVQTVASAAEQLSASIAEISRQVSRSTDQHDPGCNRCQQANTQIRGLAEAAQRIGDVVKLDQRYRGADRPAWRSTRRSKRRAPAKPARGLPWWRRRLRAWPTRPPRPPTRSAPRSPKSRSTTTQSVQAMQTIGRTIGEISEVSTAIASAVEQQGAATNEIARNVQHASAGTDEVSSNVGGHQSGRREIPASSPRA